MPTAQPLHWYKSTRSGGQGGQCVEVAVTPTAATLTVTPEAWQSFVGTVAHFPG